MAQRFVCAILAVMCLMSGVVGATPATLVVSPINESERAVPVGNTRPEARPEFDLGIVDDSLVLKRIQLLLKRPRERELAAETLADNLQRAGSNQFHQWLTASQYAEQFGAYPEDISTISAWLRSYGFTVLAPSPSRMTIDFSGTAGQVRAAFSTEIHKLNVHGEEHIANMRDPSIPAALALAIEGVVSLHDFRPRPTLVYKPQYTYAVNGVTVHAVVPADLATIYHFNPLFAAKITGQGQTIAVIENSDLYNPNDWSTFRKTFGLASYSGAVLQTIHPGGCTDPGANEFDAEASLDVEWASAAAPSASILVASCANTNTSFGILIAIQNLLNQSSVPPIVSLSYGDCEVDVGAATNAAFRTAYQQAALEGVSVFVAAADDGADTCASVDPRGPVTNGLGVNAFASTVYNIAVGGTDFGDSYAGTVANYWSPTNGPTYGSALSYVPEIPGNDTCASTLITTFLGYKTPYGPSGFCASSLGGTFLIPTAGGGGASSCATGSVSGTNAAPCQGWKKPSWQSVLGNPNDGVRDLPDVSMFAADGVWGHFYLYCNSDPKLGAPCVGAPSNWTRGGGTSFATPIMAGIQALVNQVTGSREGNPAPIYYAIARQEYGMQGNKNCASFAPGGPASACTFYDVTLGDNDIDCTGTNNCYAPPGGPNVIGVLSLSDNSYEPTYPAATGWDFASGIGTVNAYNLVHSSAWASTAP